MNDGRQGGDPDTDGPIDLGALARAVRDEMGAGALPASEGEAARGAEHAGDVIDRYELGEEKTVLYAGIAFACLAVMMVVVQFGYVQPRKPDPRGMLPAGLILIAFGYVLANLLAPFWAVCLAFLIVGGGAALAVPAANALGSLSVDREDPASAAALLAAAPPSGFIFGPLIGAPLYQFAAPLPLYVSAGVMGLLGAYAILVVARRPIG